MLLWHPVISCKSTVVCMVSVEVRCLMGRDVESVDWVLDTEVVMVDLIFVEGTVCTKVSFTWVVNPVMRTNRWVMWSLKVRISEMWCLMVWSIVMGHSWVMRRFVNWCSMVWRGVVWCGMYWRGVVRCGMYWCVVVGCILNKMRKSWVC